ncbi:uncharacterized protein [Neodiprion pinetum]|uniref:uncharacterized protein isoform X1 n=1 Tax=Neodiprion pinetum TaxID=441929 RepID=UPI001EDF34B7|nr:uncharacterized protein LOC124223896 isoform X1 [Neodiprion pinetum]
MGETPKVEFAVGSEVSSVSFYKSSFARSFAMNARETKSLDFAFMNGETIAEEPNSSPTSYDNRNNNFVLHNSITGKTVSSSDVKLWRINESITVDTEAPAELDKLRKEYQNLAEENRRLQNNLAVGRTPQSRVIDNVLLQTQIDTLQWQLKQTEANREMYRALMAQVVRFLERAHKSLDILHEKSNPKNGKASRVPRSRSVHGVDESSVSRGSHQSSASCASFARAKSVTQISPTSGTNRDSTSVWSVLRRTETPPPGLQQPRPEVQPHEGVVYRRRPTSSENNPDEVPPERLSQEAFRLMRTAQSLLATREPDLVRVSEVDNRRAPSPCNIDGPLPLQSFTNSTPLCDSLLSSSDRANSRCDNDATFSRRAEPGTAGCLLPGARRSLDAASLHSASSKTTETTEEEDGGPRSLLAGALEREFVVKSSSTPNRRPKKPTEVGLKTKPCTASVSSAEDESGFSSMSSFQDVGLPPAPSLVKGYHTEVGLPDVPVKVRHRRWSSTPAEMQALFNGRYNASFTAAKTGSEALKVLWV